ncbi:MAG: 2-hydroxyacid dehydrogenase, partial [Roseomonas sp.]|nr:2-hydroxyacid dehydrogenase [Roseomonas sp.]
SGSALEDDVLARLTTFPNVMITSHQGFLTNEALENIADTVLCEVSAYARGDKLINPVLA